METRPINDPIEKRAPGKREVPKVRDTRPSLKPEPQAPESHPDFDYSSIPEGFYDEIFHSGSPVRRCWHIQKFERILSCLPEKDGGSILDIGCFSGTFLSLIEKQRFHRQLGVDLLENQIQFANRSYGTNFREFRFLPKGASLRSLSEKFDCITLIEVIEHLTREQIQSLFTGIFEILKPGGQLVFSTPNYTSSWPIIELALNRVSDVTYEEQHVTKFTYFNVVSKLRKIVPEFDTEMKVEFKTTTHFITPFLAWMGVDTACKLSRLMPHNKWRMPFGNLVVVSLRRR